MTANGNGNLSFAWFKSCHFIKPVFIFNDHTEYAGLAGTILKDVRFSNGNRTVEFEGKSYFSDLFDNNETILKDFIN